MTSNQNYREAQDCIRGGVDTPEARALAQVYATLAVADILRDIFAELEALRENISATA
jgi:hypothetical protein